MRKVIQHPDGRQETVEGTPEEIAEYERQLREGGKPRSTKKKPVIHGAEVDGKELSSEEVMLVRLHRMGVLPKKEPEQVFIPWMSPVQVPLAPYTPQPCWFCGQLDCRQTHIWCGTVTSDKISLNTDNTAAVQPLLQQTVDNALASFDMINKGWTPPIKG